ncbi:MAG: heparinase II/III family protein [Clostridia bacterium]|nr:heparinase II/III family protein [Clostridia bacterium]
MFEKWLSENNLSDISFSATLFPPATDVKFWEGVIPTEFVTLAEEYIGYEWPLIRATHFMEFQKSGNRLIQEKPHFERRETLRLLFIAELKEHKGRFLPDICDGIFAICEESYWGVSAHSSIIKQGALIPDASVPYIDLFVAETAELLSVIYSVMYDDIYKFCPELLSRLEYELDRRIVTPYLTHVDFWWMGYVKDCTINNWNPWILSNILTVFLLTNQRKTVLESGIKKMFSEINRYYHTVADDGGCDEGSNYWTVAGGKLFEFCNVLYAATDGKIDFFGDEKLKKIWLYLANAYIDGNYFVNFSDGDAKILKIMDYALYTLGTRTGNTELCNLAGVLKRNRSQSKQAFVNGIRSLSIKSALNNLICEKNIDAKVCFKPDEIVALPVVQHCFVRESDWYYAAKGGHNAESHNHNDVANFIVFNNGQPVIIDVGCGVYTRFTFSEQRYTIWTMQSGYHNLPVINGVEQKNGEEFCADGFCVTDKNTEISYAKAYPDSAGVKKAVRNINSDIKGVSVEDSFEFEEGKNEVEEHILTLLKPVKADGGIVLGDKFFLKTDLEGDIEFKSFEGDKKLISAWETGGIYRIKLYAKCGKTASVNYKITRI